MRRFFRFDTTEFVLRSAGVALAAGSFAFAAHMLGDPNRKPEIVGLEHLAIYAKPTRPVAPRVETAAKPEIDYTPVGALSEANLIGFEVVDAAPGRATIRTPQGRLARVAPGGRLAGAGSILSIERRDGKWTVFTQAGVIRQR